ncbi:zinc finger protein JACKDAW-like [Apium graveolens]|uniref:zinc finger protein JACKDAW-like n=1 Tax=Apium graveolens TaxID=4045 RepID=UPI003D7AA349
MAAPSATNLFDLKEEELKNKQIQPLPHSPEEGANSDMAGAASQKRKRNSPGNPCPDAEVIQLSPTSLMATNRFLCEVCNKGFQREQNLQLHRRGHNLPWKLKQKSSHEVMRRKVYICPEPNCVHHDPARALGDLTGIKKHFFRKHGEKKFNCDKCNKKYAVQSDWKAHNKICGTKEYKCDCGNIFTRRDSFLYHRSFCDALAEEVSRQTTNPSPYSSMASSILANSSNVPGSMSMGSAAGSLILGNHQQFSSPLYGLGATRPNSFTSLLSGQSIDQSVFQPLHPGTERKLTFPRASNFSGIHGFPCYTATSNMLNFGMNCSADLGNPHNDLDLNTNSSFTGLMMNAEASAFTFLNSNSATPQLSNTALHQKAAVTGSNSNNVSSMKSVGSSLSFGMKFNSYTGYMGDGMNSGGGIRGGSYTGSLGDGMYIGAGGYEGGMENRLSDPMNARFGGMMYTVNNADGMLDGEVSNNVLVEPEMSEYCDKLTRDFLGMGNGMNNLSGGGMVDAQNGNGMGPDSPDSEATTSAEVGPFVPGRCPGF